MDRKNQLHSALIGAFAVHKKRSMQEFQKLDLTAGQPKVLSVLSKKEGYLQKDLAEEVHVQPATISNILNNMQDKDMIYKKQEYVSGGKRAFAIYLTDKGRDIAEKVNEIVNDTEELSFHGFNDTEKKQLINLLNRVRSNLENDY